MADTQTTSGFTRTSGVPLFWKAFGDPKAEPLLVLHGGPGAHHDYLLPQMLALAETRLLIFYDQRGGGQSRDDSRDPITWQTHVADLATVIEEFQLGNATVVGYSWGGLLSMLYATMSQEKGGESGGIPMPARMVLISPAPAASSFRREMETDFSARQQSDRVVQGREELRLSGRRESDPEGYKQRLFELSVSGYFHDPERTRELTPFRVVGRVQESVWKSLGDYDILPALRTLSIPALVVHGRDDPIPMQSSLAVADALKARLLLLEKCGHVPYVEQPRALFSAIENFLEDNHVKKPE